MNLLDIYNNALVDVSRLDYYYCAALCQPLVYKCRDRTVLLQESWKKSWMEEVD